MFSTLRHLRPGLSSCCSCNKGRVTKQTNGFRALSRPSAYGLIRQVRCEASGTAEESSPMQTAKDAVTNAAQGIKDAVRGVATGLTWTKDSIRDLTGWTILILGASDGVGFESAKAFAEHNAHVVVHGRNPDKTKQATEQIKQVAGPKAKVEYMLCDLTSFKSIRAFAEEYRKKGYPIHVLLNNAGVQQPTGYRGAKTEDGFEVTVGTNHFGLVYMTLQLLDIVKNTAKQGPTARIVWVASIASQFPNPPGVGATSDRPGVDLLMWDDLKGEKLTDVEDSDFMQYARTKLMNLMTSRELARRLESSGVLSFACHPGVSRTDHFGIADTENSASAKAQQIAANLPITGQSAETGAIPLEYACTSEDLEGKTGAYIGAPELGLVNYIQAREITPNAPMASDPEACKRLWNETIKIINDVSGEDWSGKIPEQ